jgi:hypothetical protein
MSCFTNRPIRQDAPEASGGQSIRHLACNIILSSQVKEDGVVVTLQAWWIVRTVRWLGIIGPIAMSIEVLDTV